MSRLGKSMFVSKVKAGDTLWRIAKRFHVPMDYLFPHRSEYAPHRVLQEMRSTEPHGRTLELRSELGIW